MYCRFQRQMSSRAHIHDADCQWMSWLKECSKLKGVSGKSLYNEYTSDQPAWQSSTCKLRTELCPKWPFCRRGAAGMSSADIASARHRYLDRYPLTAEEKCSARYVDALLEIDTCQIRARQESTPSNVCPGCVEKNRTIASLRAALSDNGSMDVVSIDNKIIRSIFYRNFILDGTSSTTRTEVREVIEQCMKNEMGPGAALPCSSPAWVRFLRHSLGISSTNTGPIKCLRRLHPIALPDED